MTTTVKLSEFRERKMAGAINIETDDGQVFTIPPPELWPDECSSPGVRGDTVATARALLGDRYDAFLDAGGTAAALNAIFVEHHSDEAGNSSAS